MEDTQEMDATDRGGMRPEHGMVEILIAASV